MLRVAYAAGYTAKTSYLWQPSDNASLRSVRSKVRQGGPHVSSDDIRRRYLPSVRNFSELCLTVCCSTRQPIRRQDV